MKGKIAPTALAVGGLAATLLGLHFGDRSPKPVLPQPTEPTAGPLTPELRDLYGMCLDIQLKLLLAENGFTICVESVNKSLAANGGVWFDPNTRIPSDPYVAAQEMQFAFNRAGLTTEAEGDSVIEDTILPEMQGVRKTLEDRAKSKPGGEIIR